MGKLAVHKFGMTMHLNMDHGNTALYSGEINQPDHKLHGMTIQKKVFTPKNPRNGSGLGRYGTPEVEWIVQDGSEEPPVFKQLQQLMDHYKLKSIE